MCNWISKIYVQVLHAYEISLTTMHPWELKDGKHLLLDKSQCKILFVIKYSPTGTLWPNHKDHQPREDCECGVLFNANNMSLWKCMLNREHYSFQETYPLYLKFRSVPIRTMLLSNDIWHRRTSTAKTPLDKDCLLSIIHHMGYYYSPIKTISPKQMIGVANYWIQASRRCQSIVFCGLFIESYIALDP